MPRGNPGIPNELKAPRNIRGDGRGAPGKPKPPQVGEAVRTANFGNIRAKGNRRPKESYKPGHKHTYEIPDEGQADGVDFAAIRARKEGGGMNVTLATDSEIEAALVLHHGNVTQAALELGYHGDGQTLRRRIRQSPALMEKMNEQIERGVDKAISIFWEAMDCDSLGMRLSAAKEFLRTEAARRRGFTHRDLNVNVEGRGGGIVFAWLDENTEEPKLIEGEIADERDDDR